MEFTERFASEQACCEYLLGVRWPAGFVCPNCSATKGWTTRRGTMFCSGCRRQTSPTAGTILHNSRVPLRSWFLAMWLACTQKTGLSAKGLQRELGLGSYQTAWLMLQKLRQADGSAGSGTAGRKCRSRRDLLGRQGEARSRARAGGQSLGCGCGGTAGPQNGANSSASCPRRIGTESGGFCDRLCGVRQSGP